MSSYQPAPDGVWRSSPERVLLWGVLGALHQIERAIPETKSVTRWETRLGKLIGGPVRQFPWKTLFGTYGITKDDQKPGVDVPSKITDAWATIPATISGDLWVQAAEERTSRLHLPFDPEDLKQAMASTMDMVSSIPETLHERLREIMADAYERQDGQYGFARQIRAEFADVSKFKADQIAVTEWNRAASTATLLGYTAQGVQSKVWYTVGDERVCETCESNSADGEIPIGAQFYSGDLAPPAHPGCRCDISSA